MASNTKFLGIIGQAIDGKTQKSGSPYLLHFSPSMASETSQYLYEVVDDAIEDWNVERKKITCVVTDAASNMKGMAELLGFPRATCLAHLTDNVCRSVMDSMAFLIDIVQSTKATLSHFSLSPKATRELKAIQREFNIDPRELPSYSETRWNSFYEALVALRKCSRELTEYAKRHRANGRETIKGLNEAQIEILELVNDYLKFLSDMTDEMTLSTDDSETSFGKRAVFLQKSLSFIRRLVLDGYLFAFDSWKDLKRNETAPIHIDAKAGEPGQKQSKNSFATIFVIELAVRMRHYWLTRVINDLKSEGDIISIDGMLITALGDQGWKDFDQELNAMLRSKRASDKTNVETFIKMIDGSPTSSDSQGIYRMEEDDVKKSFALRWTTTDTEDVLICLKMIKHGAINDVKEIERLSVAHVERANSYYFDSPKTADSAVLSSQVESSPIDSSLIVIESSDNIAEEPITAPPTAKSRGKNKNARAAKRTASTAPSPSTDSSSAPETPSLNFGKFHLVLNRIASAPCTSVEVERSFSVATGHVNPLRNRLDRDKFAKEVQIIGNKRLMSENEWREAMKWPEREVKNSTPSEYSIAHAISDEEHSDQDDMPVDSDWNEADYSIAQTPMTISPSSSNLSSSEISSNCPQNDDNDDLVLRFNRNNASQTDSMVRGRKRALSEIAPNPLPVTAVAPESANSSTIGAASPDEEDLAIANAIDRAQKKRPPPIAASTRSRSDAASLMADWINGKIDEDGFWSQQNRYSNTKAADLKASFYRAAKRQFLPEAARKFLTALRNEVKDEVAYIVRWVGKKKEEIKSATAARGTRTMTSRSSSGLQTASSSASSPKVPQQKHKIPDTIDSILKSLKERGLKNVNVPGLGNCFFEALIIGLHKPVATPNIKAYQELHPLPKSHEECRAQVIAWMAAHPETWTDSIVEEQCEGGVRDPLGWLDKMAEDRVWAEDQVISAAASCYNINLEVIVLNSRAVLYEPDSEEPVAANVVLINFSGTHFQAAIDRGHKCHFCQPYLDKYGAGEITL